MAVEGAVSAQFEAEIPAFAKPVGPHAGQYCDRSVAPLTASDAAWAIGKAKEAQSGVKELLAASPSARFG